MTQGNNSAERQIDQKRLDNWYTAMLSKHFGTENPVALRFFAHKHGTRMYQIQRKKGGQVKMNLVDKNHRVIAQRPLEYFLTK